MIVNKQVRTRSGRLQEQMVLASRKKKENRTMEFRIKADAKFDAEDIDDAFRQLAEHFGNVIDSSFQFVGLLEIKPEQRE